MNSIFAATVIAAVTLESQASRFQINSQLCVRILPQKKSEKIQQKDSIDETKYNIIMKLYIYYQRNDSSTFFLPYR